MKDMAENSTTVRRQGVVACGNWLVDHVKMIDLWPMQEGLAIISSQSEGNGGGPYNLLKDLAKLECGFPLLGVGWVGRDADGDKILRDCEAHGIDCAGLRQTDAAPTSFTDVMTVAATGKRTFFHHHGANARLSARDINLSGCTAKIFYLAYLGLLRELDRLGADGATPATSILAQARAQGMITAADLVSGEACEFAKVVNPSLPELDYLFLNEFELAGLVGEKVTHEPAQLEAQARVVLSRGLQGAVVVHTPSGGLCVRRDKPAHIQPAVVVPQSSIAGTAGAGDAFAAGFLFGVHQEWLPEKCLELAVCVAAASLRHETCSQAVESWTACLRLGRSCGFRPNFTAT